MTQISSQRMLACKEFNGKGVVDIKLFDSMIQSFGWIQQKEK